MGVGGKSEPPTIEELQAELQRHAMLAVRSLAYLCKYGSNRDALNASRALLDRIGLGPQTKHEVTGKDGAPIIDMTYEQSLEVLEEAKRLAKKSGIVD